MHSVSISDNNINSVISIIYNGSCVRVEKLYGHGQSGLHESSEDIFVDKEANASDLQDETIKEFLNKVLKNPKNGEASMLS